MSLAQNVKRKRKIEEKNRRKVSNDKAALLNSRDPQKNSPVSPPASQEVLMLGPPAKK